MGTLLDFVYVAQLIIYFVHDMLVNKTDYMNQTKLKN